MQVTATSISELIGRPVTMKSFRPARQKERRQYNTEDMRYMKATAMNIS